jgi:pyridoxal 5'-phosphate synthase pdxT subunit
MKIGVLALQGDFLEHITILGQLGVQAVAVRLPSQLAGLDGLIIPGGESTTIGKLAVAYHLLEPIRQFGREKAIWGTCAGAIFLARDVGMTQPLLGLMDITITRNAFGSQVNSFETDLDIPALCQVDPQTKPYHAIFIRAPLIDRVSGQARALATLPDGKIVVAQEGRWLATSFHPELTGDDRFHKYFVEMCK